MSDQEAAAIAAAYMQEHPEMIPKLEDAYRRGWHPHKIAEAIVKSYSDAVDQILWE